MLGFFSLKKEKNLKVNKEQIYFVSIPQDLNPDDIKMKFASTAQVFANKLDANKVYLIYGKDEYIEYDYSI